METPITPQEMIARGVARIDAAYQQFQPVAIFGLFSGGHDSLTATYIASQHPKFTAAIHINTGIGVEQTREFVRTTCQERGWPLREYKAMEHTRADGTADPQDYRAFVRQYGFPGAHGHGMMYARLKERQLRAAIRDAKRGHSRRSCVMLVSGCRSQESSRRMGNTEEVQKRAAQLWVAPIHDLSKLDCSEVIKFAGLKRNLVVDLIHKSGECLCGAFAKKGELSELELWFPEKAAEIRALEAEVEPKFGWGWEGQPPPKKRKQDVQQDLPLCYNCLVEYGKNE